MDVMIPLQKPDFQILKWSEDDIKSTSTAARLLASPLETGSCLHKDLQRIYLTAVKSQSKKNSSASDEMRATDTEGEKPLAASNAIFDEDGYEPMTSGEVSSREELLSPGADNVGGEDSCPLNSEKKDNDSISDGYV